MRLGKSVFLNSNGSPRPRLTQLTFSFSQEKTMKERTRGEIKRINWLGSLGVPVPLKRSAIQTLGTRK